MTLGSKRELIQAIRRVYWNSSKKQKGLHLDHLELVTGLKRNYLNRLLLKGYKHRRRKPGRKSRYAHDPQFMEALKRIWGATRYLSGKLLKRSIKFYIPVYEAHWGVLPLEVTSKLLKISPATIDRILLPTKRKLGKGKSTTSSDPHFRDMITISLAQWEQKEPGHLEGDLVAHCGNTTAGVYVNTLTVTDIATGWVENRAIWGKTADAVVEALKDIKQSLPFPIKSLDFDNGTEFLNSKVFKFCQNEGIPLTRSRPYKKNDNAHVEQKNWMTARDALGFRRMENPDIVPVANELYKNDYRLFKNYFTPCFKLKEKLKVGSRYKRIYDTPMTPLERVLESEYIGEEEKQKLKIHLASLDPFQISKNIDRTILRIKAMAKVSFDEWQLLPESQKLLTFLYQ
jgi:hypothetical protein